MNPHLLLGAAVVAELVGTTALKLSEGFSRALPTAGVLVGYGLGFYLLALVFEDLPVGLVYATRAALGVVGVAVIGALGFGEQVDLAGLVLGLIVAGVYVVTAVSGRAGYAV
jgi:small multidrug resistance pump